MHSPSDHQRPLVVGVGNAYRRDDGVGHYVARSLRSGDVNADVIDESGEGAQLMFAWQNRSRVILIDAVRTGRQPGKLHVMDPAQQCIPSDLFHYSTHAFSVAEAIEMSRALDELPPEFLIYGIEGQDFSSGQGLSDMVRSTADELVTQLSQTLQKDQCYA